MANIIQIEISDHIENFEFTRDVELDGLELQLRFVYNSYGGFWNLYLQDKNSTLLRIYKCICNFDILLYESSLEFPSGQLFFFTEDRSKSVAQLEDFKSKAVTLFYVE